MLVDICEEARILIYRNAGYFYDYIIDGVNIPKPPVIKNDII